MLQTPRFEGDLTSALRAEPSDRTQEQGWEVIWLHVRFRPHSQGQCNSTNPGTALLLRTDGSVQKCPDHVAWIHLEKVQMNHG